MTFQDLYLGQRVRILSWDELRSISYYGIDGIRFPDNTFFHDKMKYLCGSTLTIVNEPSYFDSDEDYLSPTTYQFTDIVPFHSKSASPNRNYYAVAVETIDLSAYTIRQLEQAVEPYYCSLRGLVSAYGSDATLPEILQIIAECVFENIETPKLVSPAADYPRAVSYQRQ